jgi:hypothetical protein
METQPNRRQMIFCEALNDLSASSRNLGFVRNLGFYSGIILDFQIRRVTHKKLNDETFA